MIGKGNSKEVVSNNSPIPNKVVAPYAIFAPRLAT
jgi:hypothetical protein